MTAISKKNRQKYINFSMLLLSRGNSKSVAPSAIVLKVGTDLAKPLLVLGSFRLEVLQMTNRFTAQSTNASLRRDEDGAIMVIGVFMAAFLVGLLYYLLGLGQTMLFRQRMQDAADATAFSSAVMNARGMNLLVLINVVMALLLAILIVLRGLQILLGVALGIAVILCAIPFTSLVGCGLVGAIEGAITTVTNAYNSLERPIFGACEALTKVNRVLRDVWWLVGQADAVTTAMNEYKPPLTVGFVWPVYEQLPTKDGTFSALCRRAAELPGVLFQRLGSAINIPAEVTEFITEMLTGFFQLAAGTICGFSTPQPQLRGSFQGQDLNDVANSQTLPLGTDGARCQGPPPDEAACRTFGTWVQQGTPDQNGGSCEDAPNRLTCEERVRAAATECNPANSNNPRDHAYFEETTEWEYEVSEAGTLVRPTMPVAPATSVIREGALPCGTGSDPNQFSAYSNGTCTQDRDAMADDWFRSLPNDQNTGRPAPQRHRVTVRAVKGILSCKVNRQPPTANVPGQPSLAASAGACRNPDIAHQVIKDCAEHLGEQVYQVLGVGIADDQVLNRFRTGNDRGLFIAAFGRQQNASGLFGGMQELARFSIAQAEFYWEMPAQERLFSGHAPGPEEFMWEMGWKARMRRVAIESFFQSSTCTRSGNCGNNSMNGSQPGRAVNEQESEQNTNQMRVLDAVLIH